MSEQGSETNNSNANNRRRFYCHQCHREIEPLLAPTLTCPRCHGDFIEEIEGNNDLSDFIEPGGADGEDFDDTSTFPGNPQNGQTDFAQIFQNMISTLMQSPNVQVQTESRDGTTTITATTTTGSARTTTGGGASDQQGEGSANQQGGNQQQPPRQNIFFMGGNAQNAGDVPPLLNFAQMFQRILLESGGTNNTANFLNFFNITGDPRDYAWGNTGWDNIITQLMEQQAGRQAPPPASDEIIENLPKTKNSVAEEKLGCPVCKDEFQTTDGVVDLPCAHTFHFDCIKPWLKMNGTCPVCRYSLVSQDNNQNEQNNNNNNNGTGSPNNNNNHFGFIYTTPNSSLPGTYPGNQQNNEQQNHQGGDHTDVDRDLD